MAPTYALFHWLLLLLFLLSTTAEQLRRLHIRDIGAPYGARCRNTVNGRQQIADDKGYLCKRDELDYASGCCKSGRQHACDLCNLADKCCSEYEACVSCCLAPQYDAANLAKITPRALKHQPAGFWNDAFDYCQGTCRTHGRSTMHENAYISTRHHCFSQLGKPMMSEPLPAGALDGVELLMSSPNDNCAATCAKVNKSCSQRHLPLLNSCDRLREHVNCEAGCEAVQTVGALPAYIDAGAPKGNRPAMCFVAQGQDVAFDCESKEQHSKRLCPCV